ncbi:MAG: tRNA epoxyqueuosine(34) reductase QueG [Acidobacteriota bacterium]
MESALIDELEAFATGTLGFDLVGIAAVSPLPGGERLTRWVATGAAAAMTHLGETAEVRADPGRFLAGARSVVCVAMSYHDRSEAAELAARDDHVVIARYARRADYHKVIKRRLTRLGRWLAARAPGTRWRTAVDTAPVLERELSCQAGLGWIGKNTCLVNRRLGSELLLGELVTDVELPPGEAQRDHCGACTACLDACPTGALAGPHFLDCRRCIAYLTLEQRDELPPELIPSLGAHLAGCDICQAVCPWNRRARPSCARPLATRPPLASLSFAALRLLDEEGWRGLAAGTPLRRLGFSRFRRNLDAIAANFADNEAARTLIFRTP